MTAPAKRLGEALDQNKGQNSAEKNQNYLWLLSLSQLEFSLTNFFLLKLFIPFITTIVYYGGWGKSHCIFFLYFSYSFLLQFVNHKANMNSLGSLELHAQVMEAWEKGLMKLDISLEVKYVLCALYHVTANLKTKGCVPSQRLAVVRN